MRPMTVRKKFLLIFSAAMALTISMIILFALLLLYHNTYDQEVWNAERGINSARMALNREIRALEKMTGDYACWDDTCEFVKGRKENYISDNLHDKALLKNNFNLVLFLDREGRLVYGQNCLAKFKQTLPTDPAELKRSCPEIVRAIAPDSPLRTHAESDSTTGVIVYHNSIYMVAARPILTSEYQGPPQGTVIFGRRYDKEMMQSLTEIAQWPVNLRLVNSSRMEPDFIRAAGEISAQSPVISINLNRSTIAAYGRIMDIYGKPAAVIRVTCPRLFHRQFFASLRYFVFTAVLLGIVLGAVVLVLTGRLVVSRLERLDRFVKGIEASHDLSQRIDISGGDEISSLAGAVNRMMENLEQDIARRERAEAALEDSERRLRQTQKMEAIGQLAGGIAHDFNNLLTPILGYSSMLEAGCEDPAMICKAGSIIGKAAERAAELTSKLLGFARRGKFLCIPVNIGEVINEVTDLLDRTIDKNITIVRRLSPKPTLSPGDPGQIHQALLNLALNARDAMPKGGRMTFTTELVALDPGGSSRYPDLASGRYIEIAISDTGHGIPREIRDRLFEPFFTTKELGKGTGMGLAMVYGIVQNHGGAIEVETEEGRGTTFRILLPASEASARESGGDGPPPTAHGQGTVMIVDDEEVVLQAASQILTELGYTVRTFNQASEAVAFFEDNHATTDLAIIDMVMPQIDGGECFRRLKSIHPGVRAILSSGFSCEGRAQELLGEGMLGFLQKPYRMDQLSAIIAETITRPRTSTELQRQ